MYLCTMLPKYLCRMVTKDIHMKLEHLGTPTLETYSKLRVKHCTVILINVIDPLLTICNAGKETVDLTLLNHYTDLYSKCLVNLCERALKRMKDDVSSILFISSPGCNITQTVSQGYDMPGKILFQS